MKFLLILVFLVPLSLQASLEDLLGASLVDAQGKPVEVSSLKGKVVGLYFSAEWCPPCRRFTPSLVEARDRNKQDFEVVFVSSDRSEADQGKYMRGYRMKWPAVPFDSEKRGELGAKFGVRGIPALVVVDDEGNLITAQGRGEIAGNAREAIRNWKKKAGSGAVSDAAEGGGGEE
jgi:nucleoredoxin